MTIEIYLATVRGVHEVLVCRNKPYSTWTSLQQIEGFTKHADSSVVNPVPVRLVDETKAVVIPESYFSSFAQRCLEEPTSTWTESVKASLRSMLVPTKPAIPPMPDGDDWVLILGKDGVLNSHEVTPEMWVRFHDLDYTFSVYRKES